MSLQETPVSHTIATPLPSRVRRLAPLAALALALLAAAPAGAQTGNQSDISGPNITGSGAAAGSYQGAGVRTENEMFAHLGDRTVFRSARIACATRTAAAAYRDSVSRLPLTPPRALVEAVALETDPARRDAVDALAARLSRGLSGEQAARARTLAESLVGLLALSCDCAPDREAYDEAPRWERALRTFNDLVDDAPEPYFAPPPDELLAVHEMLFDIVGRVLGRPR